MTLAGTKGWQTGPVYMNVNVLLVVVGHAGAELALVSTGLASTEGATETGGGGVRLTAPLG